MATRKRGQKVKADVAGSGFLNHITTHSILPPKYEPVYYQVLHDLGFADLEGDKQLIAWQIAYTTVRLYQTMDYSHLANDTDRYAHNEAIAALPKMQKSLIDLINAFHGKRREEPTVDEAETKEDFKSMIDQLLHGENDRHSEIRGEITDLPR